MRKLFNLSIALFFAFQISAQEETLKFTLVKSTNDQKTVYFHIKGIEDNEQYSKIMDRFLMDPSISDGRIFKSSTQEDRCQLVMNPEIDAAYILSILREMNLDFKYNTVSRNGHLEKQHAENLPTYETPRTPVIIEGFPEFKDTGNPEADKQSYSDRKNSWIEEHPQEYQRQLDDLNR